MTFVSVHICIQIWTQSVCGLNQKSLHMKNRKPRGRNINTVGKYQLWPFFINPVHNSQIIMSARLLSIFLLAQLLFWFVHAQWYLLTNLVGSISRLILNNHNTDQAVTMSMHHPVPQVYINECIFLSWICGN